ncbi:hypothetical protein K439DRAFT_1663332, partial [Ramaria rubella]
MCLSSHVTYRRVHVSMVGGQDGSTKANVSVLTTTGIDYDEPPPLQCAPIPNVPHPRCTHLPPISAVGLATPFPVHAHLHICIRLHKHVTTPEPLTPTLPIPIPIPRPNCRGVCSVLRRDETGALARSGPVSPLPPLAMMAISVISAGAVGWRRRHVVLPLPHLILRTYPRLSSRIQGVPMFCSVLLCCCVVWVAGVYVFI